MPDIYLNADAATPNDIILRDPTQPSTLIKAVAGVLYASISKIAGVALSAVKKIAGLS